MVLIMCYLCCFFSLFANLLVFSLMVGCVQGLDEGGEDMPRGFRRGGSGVGVCNRNGYTWMVGWTIG